jgi:hypothetical protein
MRGVIAGRRLVEKWAGKEENTVNKPLSTNSCGGCLVGMKTGKKQGDSG